MFQLTTISIVLFITTIVNSLIFFASWQRSKSKGSEYFTYGMLAATFWVLVSALDYAAVPITVKIFFAKLETVFYNAALVLFLVFFTTYAGYKYWLQKKSIQVILWVVPVFNILLPITNEWHNLYWSGFSPSPVGENVIVFHHGPAFIWVAAIGYLIIITMIVGLLQLVIRSARNTRRQALILLLALLIPAASNLLYLIPIPGLEGIDWTSVFFSLSGLMILLALFNTHFLDIVPVARNLMIEKMTDGILVLDFDERIVDFNVASQEIFELHREDIGRTLSATLPNFPVVARLSFNAPTDHTTVQVQNSRGELCYFDMRLDFLKDSHAKPIAKMIVLRDITKRYKMEAALEERVKELKCIYDLSLLVEQPNISLGEILQGSVSLLTSAVQFPESAWARLSYAGEIYTSQAIQETANILTQQILISGQEIGYVEVGYRESPDGDGQTLSFLREEANLLLMVAERLGNIIQAYRAEDELEETQEQLWRQQRELAKIEERQRMARNLHDSVSQSIHSVVLFSETLAATLDKENYERARQIMERLKESARQTHKETRLLLYELQADGPERSVNLIRDLEERLTRVERHAGVKAEIIREGSLAHCPVENKEHLFWIATEALNNAMKHAQAKNVRIIIRCSPEKIEMDIMDDGIGFQADKISIGGMGLENMRSRAELISGAFTVESRPGEGTNKRVYAQIKEDEI